MKINFKLFSLVSFEIQPIDDGPIIFKSGDSFSFSVNMTLCFSPTGLKLLANRASLDGNTIGEFGIATTVNYIDKDYGATLSGIYSPIPKETPSTTLLNISNKFGRL